jgi:hypothetical protein
MDSWTTPTSARSTPASRGRISDAGDRPPYYGVHHVMSPVAGLRHHGDMAVKDEHRIRIPITSCVMATSLNPAKTNSTGYGRAQNFVSSFRAAIADSAWTIGKPRRLVIRLPRFQTGGVRRLCGIGQPFDRRTGASSKDVAPKSRASDSGQRVGIRPRTFERPHKRCGQF